MKDSKRRIELICQALDILRAQPGGQKALAARMKIPESTLQQFRPKSPPANPAEKTLETILDYLLDSDERLHLNATMRDFLERESALRRLRNFRATPDSFEHWITEAGKLAGEDISVEGGGIGAASGALVGALFGPLGMIIGAAIAGTAGVMVGAPSVERKKSIEKLEALYRERTLQYVTRLATAISQLCDETGSLGAFRESFWRDIELQLKALEVKDAQIQKFKLEFENFPSVESLTGVTDFDLLRDTMRNVLAKLTDQP